METGNRVAEDRITIKDRPRSYKTPSQRSPQAIAFYDLFHAEAVARGWVNGDHPEIDWCLLHGRPVYYESGKSWCEQCVEEAQAFALANKVHRPPPKGNFRPPPVRRKGDITGKKSGHVQPSRQFNPYRKGPRLEPSLFIERRGV